MTDVPEYVISGVRYFRDEMISYIDLAFSMTPENGKTYLLEKLIDGTKEIERADFYFGPNQPRGV